MALSSQWSQAVVVRSDCTGEVIVPPTPNNSTARAHAASGNPIIVRPRDPEVFTACGKDSTQGSEGGGGGRGMLVTAIMGRDISETFWIPDPSRNEMGLLEMLHRRGSTNRTPIILQSRPLPELQFNFSTCTGHNIDLSHNAFRLSKTAMALQQIDRTLGADEDDYPGEVEDVSRYGSHRRGGGNPGSPLAGQITMSTRGFRQTVRTSLQTLQEEDYYLVKYRDYSAWAVNQYRSIAKSDSVFGKKYIEQCFALHVGREPGELLLITEAQFLFGVDILQRQLLNQLSSVPTGRQGDTNRSTYLQYQLEVNFCALNADQFRSLGALLGDGMRQVAVEGEERRRAEAEKEARNAPQDGRGGYVAPAWYDWSPGAIRARVQHRLSHYYLSVGRLTIQLIVLGCCAVIVYRAVKDYIPAGEQPEKLRDQGGRGARRGGRRGNRRRSDYYDDEFGDEDYRPGLLRSLFLGPREVLDYVLAPRSQGRD